jgi:hypothetical protein
MTLANVFAPETEMVIMTIKEKTAQLEARVLCSCFC